MYPRLAATPELLAELATLVAQTASSLDDAVSAAAEALSRVKTPAAWTATVAERRVARTARQVLVSLVEEMDETAVDLRRAGDAYVEADRRSARRQGAVGW